MHGATPEEAEPFFDKYRLTDVVRVSDPALAHYRAFGLGRTGAQALMCKGTPFTLNTGTGPRPIGPITWRSPERR